MPDTLLPPNMVKSSYMRFSNFSNFLEKNLFPMFSLDLDFIDFIFELKKPLGFKTYDQNLFLLNLYCGAWMGTCRLKIKNKYVSRFYPIYKLF